MSKTLNAQWVERSGLPGHERGYMAQPWMRHGWCGRMPARVWAPVSWAAGDWCRDVLALDPCAYCGGAVEVIDHIVPEARGGENAPSNLTPACRVCNNAKQAKSLLQFLVSPPTETQRRGDAPPSPGMAHEEQAS